jgi:hypothetical protein
VVANARCSDTRVKSNQCSAVLTVFKLIRATPLYSSASPLISHHVHSCSFGTLRFVTVGPRRLLQVIAGVKFHASVFPLEA